jgi:hypothetical protein
LNKLSGKARKEYVQEKYISPMMPYFSKYEYVLPRFQDQTLEMIALQYVMLDYLIDRSPFSSEEFKDQLREKRFNLTGTYDQDAYFRWFLQNIGDEHYEDGSLLIDVFNKDLDNIEHNGSPTQLQRYKKVYNFMLDQAERAKRLAAAASLSRMQ